MPNMDDIAFFDSQCYQHRGGIWQDASRHERQPSLIPEEKPDETHSTHSTHSTPVPDGPSTTLTDEPLSQPRSQSVEEISADISSHSPPAPGAPISDVPAQELPLPPPINNRRRSWFSSVRSENRASLVAQDYYVDVDAESDDRRGRTPESGEAGASSRSHSTPHRADTPLPETPGQEKEDPNFNTNPSPQPSLRSSSRRSSRSSKSEHVKSKSIDSTSDTTPSTPNKDPSNKSTPSSPNSFLSTLKSRAAGDKQALSNTAKEAMRKWGVNWANLRKDTSNKASSSDGGSDHGSIGSLIGSRLLSDSHGSAAHKTRASYAEVRAAVEERKGRDQNTRNNDGDLSRSPSPVPALEGSAIEPGEEVGGKPSVTVPQTSASLSTPEPIVVSYSSASSSGHLSVGETSSVSRKSSPTSLVPAELDVPDIPESAHPPIHVVQPRAKTMTIPGIHASHRGEIMSMGYNAPLPQTAAPEGKSSIQSVYRLWKSPPPSGQDQLQQQQRSQPLMHQSERNADERNKDFALGRGPSPPPPVPPRPVPPPLPPRSIPTAVSTPPVGPSAKSEAAVSSPSASQALKSIATKDERKRASLENGTIVSLPPGGTDIEPLVTAGSSDPDRPLAKTPSMSRSTASPDPSLVPPRRLPSP